MVSAQAVQPFKSNRISRETRRHVSNATCSSGHRAVESRQQRCTALDVTAAGCVMLHDLGHTPGHNTLHDTSQWNSAAAVTLDDDEDWTACLDLLAGGDERSLAHPEVKPGLRGSLATQGVTELQKSKPLGHLRCGAIERRRESQRSFRARAKERDSAAHGLLVAAKDRLKQSERERIAVENKYKVLESLVFQQATPAAKPQLEASGHIVIKALRCSPRTAHTLPSIVKDLLVPAVKLQSSTQSIHYMSPFEISQLPRPAFARLYAAAMQHMLAPTSSHCSRTRQQEGLIQAISMKLTVVICTPGQAMSLECVSLPEDETTFQPFPSQAHVALAHMQLTDSQVRDLLALWRAFTEQMATLQLERKSLILNLDREYCSIDTAKSCSQRLQMNIEQEFQMYYEVVAAAHLGVLTSAQNTAWMVATYPSLLTAPIFTTLARRHKKPVMHDVLGQPPPADTLSNWGHVSKYVYSITVHNMLTYVPFLPNIEEAHGGAS